MIFNLMKPVPVQTATMYLYGREADKTVTYNGVELPDLPVWDKTAYPYVFIYYKDSDSIVNGSHYAKLYLCANPLTAYEGGMESMPYITITKLQITGSYLQYGMVSDEKMLESVTEGMSAFLGDLAYLTEANKWEYMVSGEDKAMDYGVDCLWANHDIIHTNGTTTISATDPVTTYTNADVTINGVGYVGAVLPKLPEWDKTAYPYASIRLYEDRYLLYVSVSPVKIYGGPNGELGKVGSIDYGGIGYDDFVYYTAVSNEWVESGSNTHAYITDEQSLFWSNHDLYITSSDNYELTDKIFLVASDPVPVYE